MDARRTPDFVLVAQAVSAWSITSGYCGGFVREENPVLLVRVARRNGSPRGRTVKASIHLHFAVAAKGAWDFA
jgi:hypothetical protein